MASIDIHTHGSAPEVVGRLYDGDREHGWVSLRIGDDEVSLHELTPEAVAELGAALCQVGCEMFAEKRTREVDRGQ